MNGRSRATLAVALCATFPCALGAQAGGRGVPPDGLAGFVAIFDGTTLRNWDGDTTYWRAENGAIVGESTAERRVTQNTFLIWRGGTTADFELKLEYRLSANANSGVQYRSALLPNIGAWVLKGYQADLDGADRYSGQIYEERARGFLAVRGAFTRSGGAGITQIGTFGDDAVLKALLKPNDWNSLHIIARGNTIVQVVNGRVMSAIVDEDSRHGHWTACSDCRSTPAPPCASSSGTSGTRSSDPRLTPPQ